MPALWRPADRGSVGSWALWASRLGLGLNGGERVFAMETGAVQGGTGPGSRWPRAAPIPGESAGLLFLSPEAGRAGSHATTRLASPGLRACRRPASV